MSTTMQYAIPLVLLTVTYLLVGVAAHVAARRLAVPLIPVRHPAKDADEWLRTLNEGSADA
jgi:hypothetical protein